MYSRLSAVAVCHPESLAAVENCCKYSSKSPPLVKTSGIEHDARAAKTAPMGAVDVLGAAGDRRMRDNESRLPESDPGPPPPLEKIAFDLGADDASLNWKLRNVLKSY